jgi:predicted transcriptional regulator
VDNGRDALIVAFSAAGRSVRSIAREVGLSRSRVHQILSTEPAAADGLMVMI